MEVSVQTEAKGQEGGAEQSPETAKKERTQKKRKEKPREGTSKKNIIQSVDRFEKKIVSVAS